MIEFNGYISGAAESHRWTYSRKIGFSIVIPVLLFLMPLFVYISYETEYWALLFAYIAFCIIVPMFLLIPQTQKYKNGFNIKRVFLDGEYIVAQFDKGEEFALISDAKSLVDYGEFYHIVFPFGKISEVFICQKSLLTSGILEEFEALFEGKIVRKQMRRRKK